MAFTSGNDFNILQPTDKNIVGAGLGNDTYILADNFLSAGQQINISDSLGANTLHLIGGLAIVSSKIAANTLQLTLNNGAFVTVLGANHFNYTVGGNPLSGELGVSKSFQAFATESLGAVDLPIGSNVIQGVDKIVINADGTTHITTPILSTLITQANSLRVTNNSAAPALPASHPVVAGLIEDTEIKWLSKNLTYSFPTIQPNDYNGNSYFTDNWSTLNAAERSAVRSTLEKMEQIVSLSFSEVSGGLGDLRFSVVDMDQSSTGFANVPSAGPFTDGALGDVFLATFNRTAGASYAYQPKDDGFATVLHEIGHAVGLKHPFESPVVPMGTDNMYYSLMSYTNSHNLNVIFSASGPQVGAEYGWLAMPANYAIYDVAALQALYGANVQTRAGNDVYTISSRDFEYKCIWDAGGTDTINAASATGACTVNLNPGTLSTVDFWSLAEQQATTIAFLGQQGFIDDDWVSRVYTQEAEILYTGENNLSIAYGTIIENVITGSADDKVTDNAYDNYIHTGAGNDTIYLGFGGFDMVDGGSAMDTVVLSTVTKIQIQQERQGDGSLLLLAPSFAVQLVGVEFVTCMDGALTLID